MPDVPPRQRAAAALKLRELAWRRRVVPYRADPCGYARDILQLRLTPAQETILASVATRRRTVVKGSHAFGKTFCAAVALCWWYDCWDEHIGYVTAPTWHQAMGLTFKQVKSLRRRHRLPGTILEMGKVRDPSRSRDGSHFLQAINAESGEGFQGEHSAPILVVIEEGPGVPGYIYQAVDTGLMTHPENRVLLLGNPTDESTPFGEACRDSLFHVITVSVFDHPNITAELHAQPPPFPEAVRLLWLYENLKRECEVVPEAGGDSFEFYTTSVILDALNGVSVTEDSPRCHYLPNAVFQGRALAVFPTQVFEQVIPAGWVEHLPKDTPIDPLWRPEIGCDVARYGDDRTVIATRMGPVLWQVDVLRRLDQAVVLGALRLAIQAAANRGGVDPRRVQVRIDITGGLGTGPCDILQAEGYAVEGVNSSSAAFDTEQFHNRRSELWFSMRERVRTRDCDISRLDPDTRATLVREWSAPRWRPDGAGKRVVDPKETTKKTLKRGWSPDLADAVNLCYSPGTPAADGQVAIGPDRHCILTEFVTTTLATSHQESYTPHREALGGFAVSAPRPGLKTSWRG